MELNKYTVCKGFVQLTSLAVRGSPEKSNYFFTGSQLCDTADRSAHMSAVAHSTHVCCVTQQKCLMCHTADMSAFAHSRHVCRVTQPTCLLSHTADMSVVSHSRHVCCVTQQTCLLCHTADMSAVRHDRHVCCVRQQTCRLCDTADMSAVCEGRHVCCVTHETFLLCDTADMCAVCHSRHVCRSVCCVTQLTPCKKVITFFRASANSQAGKLDKTLTDCIFIQFHWKSMELMKFNAIQGRGP